jgi:hypothetical protein
MFTSSSTLEIIKGKIVTGLRMVKERKKLWRMPSSWMRCRVALVRTDFRGAYRLRHQDEKNQRGRNVSSVLPLLVTDNVVPCSFTLFTLMMEAIRTSETSVLTRATEDGILHSRRCGNLNLTKTKVVFEVGPLTRAVHAFVINIFLFRRDEVLDNCFDQEIFKETQFRIK